MARTDVTRVLAIAAAAGGAVLMAQRAGRRRVDFDVRGKTVLINGGSRGLGLVLGRQLARRGANLVLTARDARELDIARQELEHMGARVFTVSCDSRNRDEVQEMVRRSIEHFGRIDALINVAGTILVGPIETMKLEDYHEQMDSNYWSAVNACYYVVPHMQERGGGRIVNISSIGGKFAVPHLVPYCGSKFALLGFSRGIRSELLKDDVIVTTVCPGLMRTGSPRNAMFKGQNEKEYAWFIVSDSMPGISMRVEHAAEDIIDAMCRGQAEVVLSVPAKIAAIFDQAFPEISSALTAMGARMLPGPGGIGTKAVKGAESESAISESGLTSLTREAEREHNQMQR